jgi:hypothetical protein
MKCNLAKHLLEQRHTSDTTEDNMDVVHNTSKGRLLNVIKKFYIYRETKINNQISNRNPVTPNIIFDSLLRMNVCRHNTTATLRYFHFCQFPTDVLQYLTLAVRTVSTIHITCI